MTCAASRDALTICRVPSLNLYICCSLCTAAIQIISLSLLCVLVISYDSDEVALTRLSVDRDVVILQFVLLNKHIITNTMNLYVNLRDVTRSFLSPSRISYFMAVLQCFVYWEIVVLFQLAQNACNLQNK